MYQELQIIAIVVATAFTLFGAVFHLGSRHFDNK